MITVGIFFEIILLTIGSLLPIMNPFSMAPLFISLTGSMDDERRRRQALKGCLYAFAVLTTFLLIGTAIVDFFGISIAGIRVAGGLIITIIGMRMLFPDITMPAPNGTGDEAEADISFTPLAVPSIAGPGSISVVLAAASQVWSDHPGEASTILPAVAIGVAVCCLIAFFVFAAAGYMVRFLGKGGIDAMTRIFGFLLICIAMQFLMTGINDFFQIVPDA